MAGLTYSLSTQELFFVLAMLGQEYSYCVTSEKLQKILRRPLGKKLSNQKLTLDSLKILTPSVESTLLSMPKLLFNISCVRLVLM